MNKLALTSALAMALAAGGCFKTKIHLQQGEGTPGAVNQSLHFSVIGIIELSAPVNLAAACPGGTAVAIDDQLSLLGGIINLVLEYIVPVEVWTPTVLCGAGGGAPPPAGGPPPAEGGAPGM